MQTTAPGSARRQLTSKSTRPWISLALGWSSIVSIGAQLVGCAGCPPGPREPPSSATGSSQTLDPLDRARIERARLRIEHLLDEAVAFWLKHGRDEEFGGFHGTLNRFGEAVEPTSKGLVQQTRHLWTFSALYRHQTNAAAQQREAVKSVADDLFQFISRHYRDEGDGEFFFKVDRRGLPLDRSKYIYAQSFAIYGFAEYAMAFGSDAAKKLALDCFRSIDATTHDGTHGGYDQTDRPHWLGHGAAKDTNTHIHLMESLTNLFRATGDQKVRTRAEELLRLILDKHVQPTHETHAEFARDFTPIGKPTISYGHDIETSWLLFDTIDALTPTDASSLREKAFLLGANAAKQGFDEQRGGFFEEGIPNAGPTKLEKIWWVQAESIAGLFRLYQCRRDTRFMDQLERTLGFCEQYLRDPNQGEWYWSVLPDGSLSQHRDLKSEEWKSSYHLVRALLFTQSWMRELMDPRERAISANR